MNILKADYKDLEEILRLQYLAYKSEAALFGTDDIPPLKQTIKEVIYEYDHGIILKLVDDDNVIIGSVRAKEENDTVYIGKLMVNPDHRGNGYGTRLLKGIEKYSSCNRCELFTSTRSVDNIRLYEKNGYKEFKREALNEELIFVYMEKYR